MCFGKVGGRSKEAGEAAVRKNVNFRTMHESIKFEVVSSMSEECCRQEQLGTFILKVGGMQEIVAEQEWRRENGIEKQLKKVLQRIRAAAKRARTKVEQGTRAARRESDATVVTICTLGHGRFGLPHAACVYRDCLDKAAGKNEDDDPKDVGDGKDGESKKGRGLKGKGKGKKGKGAGARKGKPAKGKGGKKGKKRGENEFERHGTPEVSTAREPAQNLDHG